MSSFGLYLTIIFVTLISSTVSIDWWKRFGISYAPNNEESDQMQHKFNDLYYNNRHSFDSESDNQFNRLIQRQNQWIGDKEWPKTGQKPISLAVNTKRTVQIIPYKMKTEEYKPQVFEISSKPLPISLDFKTYSSPLNINQIFNQENENILEETGYHQNQGLMRHKVIKPVISGVNEFIKPYRHFAQTIKPVGEDIKPFVSEQVDQNNKHFNYQSTDHISVPGRQFSHNRVINHFNTGFESKSREILNSDQRSVKSDIYWPQEYHRIRSYRVLPIIIRRSDSWNPLPIESNLSQNIRQIFKMFNL